MKNRDAIVWSELLPMLPFTLGGVAIALYVFMNFEPAGLFGGLVGTLFGTGGPFYMIYLTIRGLEKRSLRASFAAC